MSNIEYHLGELKHALDKNDPYHILPTILESENYILDIGCGIGQTLIALGFKDKVCIGIDVDEEAISYGLKNFGKDYCFILSDARNIPLPTKSIDFAYSRVSLPYTNIPKVISEVSRILKSEGRFWMTLHEKNYTLTNLQDAFMKRQIKRFIYQLYVCVNGYLLQYFKILLPFINGRFESWQDIKTIKVLLSNHGFESQYYKIGILSVIKAKLKPTSNFV